MNERKLKILIVEDDMVSRRILEGMLSSYGICDIAVNGNEAVKSFKLALDNEEPYDLICLDIMMPEVDGQQALRQIRDIEKSVGITDRDSVNIIMITALDDPKNVITAFKDKGAIGYITKPVDQEKLLDEIRLLGLV